MPRAAGRLQPRRQADRRGRCVLAVAETDKSKRTVADEEIVSTDGLVVVVFKRVTSFEMQDGARISAVWSSRHEPTDALGRRGRSHGLAVARKDPPAGQGSGRLRHPAERGDAPSDRVLRHLADESYASVRHRPAGPGRPAGRGAGRKWWGRTILRGGGNYDYQLYYGGATTSAEGSPIQAKRRSGGFLSGGIATRNRGRPLYVDIYLNFEQGSYYLDFWTKGGTIHALRKKITLEDVGQGAGQPECAVKDLLGATSTTGFLVKTSSWTT
ncbi:hypothetical protein AM433_004748 [Pseudomonas aeruginosa]|nr:hypothetical protein AM433_004748 [Pseudomonas aeruginosa]